jgi:hypothetical protein
LDQDSWKTIELDYLRDPLISLLQDKSLYIHRFHGIFNEFLDETHAQNMEVSVDRMRELLERFSHSPKDYFHKDPEEVEIDLEKMVNHMDQLGISPNRNQLLSSLMFVQENTSLLFLLGCIKEKLGI